MNFGLKTDIELYNKGMASLAGDPYDGTNLRTFLIKVGERARQYNWMPLLTFANNKTLIKHYGEVTKAEVRAAATAYLAVHDRRSQNSDMMFHCLRDSITDSIHTKVANDSEAYTFEIDGETIEDGPCFLKAIIDATYTNTLSNTAVARTNLVSLDTYMESLPDSNVTQFIQHVQTQLKTLEAADETTHDLPINLFKGLRKAKDKTFRNWLQRRYDDYKSKKDPIPADAREFMEEVENYYKDRVTEGEWGKLDEDEEQIIALKAQLEARATRKRDGSRRSGRKDEKPGRKDWKTKAPRPNESNTKRVSVNGTENTYHWCPNHKMWTVHKPSECKLKEAEKKSEKEDGANKKQEKQLKKNLTLKVMHSLLEMSDDEDEQGASQQESDPDSGAESENSNHS